MLVALLFAVTTGGASEMPATGDEVRIIVDGAGRSVEIPETPERVVIAGNAALMVANASYMFPSAPARLVGITRIDQGRGNFLRQIDPEYSEKTVLERNVGPEQIAALQPDVVVMKSFMKSSLGDPVELLGIPVVYVELETPEQYDRDLAVLGELFGERQRAREIIESMHDIPVVTGHDITDDIDSVRRAHTVLLNAHLIPVIGRLIRSVGSVVAELGITDDIRLVTTEGTLMNAAEALEQPVRLVLSGPAASVKGVRFLTDFNSCVLVDMGGTTSDVAVIEGGRAKRTGRGAVVGNFRTSIHATDMRTIGLGGDSAVTWKRGVLTVGPRRILPLCVCADTYPEITGAIEKLAGYSSSDYELIQPGTCFFVSRPQETTAYLTERERAILDILGDRPLTAVELADRLSYPYHSLLGTERLEEHGIIGRAGLTPTDICVAENRLSMGNAEAARIVVELYCERTGLGFDEICEAVWREVRRSLAAVIVSETAGVLPQDKSFPGCGYCAALLDQNGLVESRYRLTVPLVGIGAPAGLMMAGLDDFLGAEKVFPEQAAVANAVGAASAAGGMHIDLSIIPDSSGRYVLYAPGENIRFRNLPEAKARGFELAQIYAESYAGRMGYGWFALDIFVHDRTAPTATMGSIYLDTSIVANMRY